MVTTSPRPQSADVPRYRGLQWLGGELPGGIEAWPRSSEGLRVAPLEFGEEASAEDVRRYVEERVWIWPRETLCVLADVHADADAFARSLVASGGVEKTGAEDEDLALLPHARSWTFVIAGDCFDKGPSTLRLLRALKAFIDTGAHVVLLVGNHDLRALLGMAAAGRKETTLAHLFVRMGEKVVPLLKEIHDAYLARRPSSTTMSQESALYRELFPDEQWFVHFPAAAQGLVQPKKIEQELQRIREKCRDMEVALARVELSLKQVKAVIDQFGQLFLQPGGEFAWFFERMQLAFRAGSLLFIHAGVDDVLVSILHERGVDGLNARFRELLDSRQLFEIYHGPIGNSFRTKYRDVDLPFTAQGARMLRDQAIHAVVHGHRNLPLGQRLVFRGGVLNVECDASVDCNTRKREHLRGPGGATTLFLPSARVLGISTDYPSVKRLDLGDMAKAIVSI